jgi:hypothetical protein
LFAGVSASPTASSPKAIYGSDERHQQVNAECRTYAEIERRQGATHIENYIREPAFALAG